MKARSLFAALSIVVLAFPLAGSANNPIVSAATHTYSQNMKPVAESPRPNPAPGVFNSDIAFWGRTAYQGTYDGFRIIDISASGANVVFNYDQCLGNQGDVVVWENIVVRSWNSPAPAGATCDGDPVPQGFEGLHVFDVSNPTDPDLVASVETECGSHTASGVPDRASQRLLIYNNPSSGACPGIDIVSVPFSNPAGASYLRFEPSGRSCHDTGVILGNAMLAACAGGNGFTVWSLGGDKGGSLEDPNMLYSVVVPTVTIGHSAAFSWDGKVLVFGHEPGGGGSPRCTPTGTQITPTIVQTDEMKSFFFYNTSDGSFIGKWTLTRDQTLTENCTLHNYNVVPTRKARVLVHGSYQSGIGVLDFTDPANAKEIAYADPAPLSTTQLVLGGDWSTYWYRGRIYESDITRGLIVWDLSDHAVDGADRLDHLNPQTQEFTID